MHRVRSAQVRDAGAIHGARGGVLTGGDVEAA
jgi:hypothetical protein